MDNLKSYSNLLNLEISPEINNNYSLLEEPFSVPEVLEFITNTKPNLNAISPSKVLVSKELVCLNDQINWKEIEMQKYDELINCLIYNLPLKNEI